MLPKKKIENREGGILFYLCPSVCPSFLPRYFSSHFSQQLLMAEIWYLVTSFTRYAISWEAFLEPSDSYFLFADFVDFYTHWTICSFFSATIDGRNLIISHKLHIGTPYRGKRFFGPIRFLLPVFRLSWFLYTLNTHVQVLVDRTQHPPFFIFFSNFHGLEICKTAIICRFLIA